MNRDEKYVGTKEMARMHGVTVRTIFRWIKSGRLTALRTPGGTPRFRIGIGVNGDKSRHIATSA